MSMMIGTGTSDVTRIEMYNRDGSYAGTMTISKPRKSTTSSSGTRSVSMAGKKKRKKLQYNFKRLSNQIMRTKTSINAKQLTTKAKFQIADLRMKLISGDYDYVEIHNALTHAEKIARVAKKRLKNLQEEENIEKTGRQGLTDPEEMKTEKEEDDEIIDTSSMSKEELEQLAKELQEEMEKIEKELEEAIKSQDDLMEEFVQGSNRQMEPHDLEMLKKKHRADEMRDIMKADMEYLRALFDKLSKEKEAGPSGLGNDSSDSSSDSGSAGVSLQIGGIDIPVQNVEAPLEIAGTNVDVMA
ncbi:MAG: DUF4175 domain-containing protein [Lachnospiraceae bacterium]|nr:DUF4175 domain-containing protein [Lachnospiraceae bacterium]